MFVSIPVRGAFRFGRLVDAELMEYRDKFQSPFEGRTRFYTIFRFSEYGNQRIPFLFNKAEYGVWAELPNGI